MKINVCCSTKPGNGPSQLPGHSIPLTPKSLTERGQRRKEVTDALKLLWGESESPGSSQRWSWACMCFQASNITRGEAMEELLAVLAAEEPCRDALARWGCLQHWGFPSSGCQGADDAHLAQVVLPKQTLASQEMASHHLRAVAWAALCLLAQSITKVLHLPFLCFREATNTHKNPALGLNIFPLVLSTDLFLCPLKIHWCAGSGEVYTKLSLPFISCTGAKNKVQICSAKDADSLKLNESLACSCCYK